MQRWGWVDPLSGRRLLRETVGKDRRTARTSGFVPNCQAKLSRRAVLRSPSRHQPTTPSRRRGPQDSTNLWLRAELPSKTGQKGSFARTVAAPTDDTEQEARTATQHEPLASCCVAKQNWPGGQFCANRCGTNRRHRAGGEDRNTARTSGFVLCCQAKLARRAVLRSSQ